MAGPLSLPEAIILGAVQGATEFLPVSSDGHLAIGAMLLEVPEMSLAMVVLLHAGTLFATLLVFGRDVRALLAAMWSGLRKPKDFFGSEQGRLAVSIVCATIPTAVVGLVLEDAVEFWAEVPWIVGMCLWGSALAVFLTRFGRGVGDVLDWKRSVVLGVFQGLAVLPGLSRSGSTIACAMLLGLSGPAAFRTSFLLSLPAVGGAVLLKLAKPGALSALGISGMVGAIVAFFVGLAALYGLRALVARGRLWWFALYLAPLGLALVLWDWLT